MQTTKGTFVKSIAFISRTFIHITGSFMGTRSGGIKSSRKVSRSLTSFRLFMIYTLKHPLLGTWKSCGALGLWRCRQTVEVNTSTHTTRQRTTASRETIRHVARMSGTTIKKTESSAIIIFRTSRTFIRILRWPACRTKCGRQFV